MWLSGEHREPIEPPSVARQNAQIRSIIKRGRCLHPKKSRAVNNIVCGGMIEYCADCMEVTDIFAGSEHTWPLRDVLEKLTEAAELLLERHNYDGHGYEEIHECVRQAKRILE